MLARQNNTLTTLRRIQGFIDTNASVLGTVNTSGARTDLDTSVTQLTALALGQKTSSVQAQGETSNQKVLRTALRDTYMAPIAAIAKAKLGAVPELSSLTMPKRTIHSQALITAANAMANGATPYAATFTAQGLAADFITQLQTAAAALQTSIDGRLTHKSTGVGATAGAKSEMDTARKVIKVLNTMVAPQLKSNATLLAQWKNVKRVTSKLGVPLGSTQTNPPAAPTPVASPTPAAAPSPAPAPIPAPTPAPTAPTAATPQEVKQA